MTACAMTVLGPVAVKDLGITLPHEHLVYDFSCWHEEPTEATRKRLVHEPVCLENLGEIRRDPQVCLDNCYQYDVDLVIEEVMHYKRAGGSTLFELTNIGASRDPLALAAIARVTGLNIIMGAAYYIAQSHPHNMDEKTIEEITDEIVRDVTVGVGDTGIRAGIIGEVGTSAPIKPNEEKVLRATGRANRKTGVPINIHVFPWGREALRVLDILEAEGANLRQVVISHADPSLHDVVYQKAVADRGAYIEYDFLGQEIFTYDSWSLHHPKDTESIAAIAGLIAEGYLEQILLSQDVYSKTQLIRYGGWGYSHILRNLKPYFRQAGIGDDQMQMMMVSNPQRLFDPA